MHAAGYEEATKLTSCKKRTGRTRSGHLRARQRATRQEEATPRDTHSQEVILLSTRDTSLVLVLTFFLSSFTAFDFSLAYILMRGYRYKWSIKNLIFASLIFLVVKMRKQRVTASCQCGANCVRPLSTLRLILALLHVLSPPSFARLLLCNPPTCHQSLAASN